MTPTTPQTPVAAPEIMPPDLPEPEPAQRVKSSNPLRIFERNLPMASGHTNRTSGVSKRGFASMDPERQREIARKGGGSVPGEKRSFSQDRSLAAQAGRKGGEASHGARKEPETDKT